MTHARAMLLGDDAPEIPETPGPGDEMRTAVSLPPFMEPVNATTYLTYCRSHLSLLDSNLPDFWKHAQAQEGDLKYICMKNGYPTERVTVSPNSSCFAGRAVSYKTLRAEVLAQRAAASFEELKNLKDDLEQAIRGHITLVSERFVHISDSDVEESLGFLKYLTERVVTILYYNRKKD